MENVFKHRDAAGRGDTLKLWPYAACLCLLAYYILTTIRAYWRLHHIPGPKLAAVSNLWWVRAVAACKGHLVLNDVCEEYGMGRCCLC